MFPKFVNLVDRCLDIYHALTRNSEASVKSHEMRKQIAIEALAGFIDTADANDAGMETDDSIYLGKRKSSKMSEKLSSLFADDSTMRDFDVAFRPQKRIKATVSMKPRGVAKKSENIDCDHPAEIIGNDVAYEPMQEETPAPRFSPRALHAVENSAMVALYETFVQRQGLLTESPYSDRTCLPFDYEFKYYLQHKDTIDAICSVTTPTIVEPLSFRPVKIYTMTSSMFARLKKAQYESTDLSTVFNHFKVNLKALSSVNPNGPGEDFAIAHVNTLEKVTALIGSPFVKNSFSWVRSFRSGTPDGLALSADMKWIIPLEIKCRCLLSRKELGKNTTDRRPEARRQAIQFMNIFDSPFSVVCIATRFEDTGETIIDSVDIIHSGRLSLS